MKITAEQCIVSGNNSYGTKDQHLSVELINYDINKLLIVLMDDFGKDVIIEKINSL